MDMDPRRAEKAVANTVGDADRAFDSGSCGGVRPANDLCEALGVGAAKAQRALARVLSALATLITTRQSQLSTIRRTTACRYTLLARPNPLPAVSCLQLPPSLTPPQDASPRAEQVPPGIQDSSSFSNSSSP